MKNLKLIGFLMIIASGLMFIQCTTDTIVGPAGADGKDGVNGTNGVDGVDGLNGLDGLNGADGVGTQECVACHSNSHRETIYAAYDISFHSKGLTEGAVAYAGARSSCAQCHSKEGFNDFQDNGFVSPTGYYGLSEPELVLDDNDTPEDPSDDFPKLDEYGVPQYSNEPVPNVNPIGCTTCHDTHISFDFVNDGNDMALRGLGAETLITDGTVIDYENTSNMCINCHQPRRTGPMTGDVDGNFAVTSSHWGPHHGPQVTFLEGIQGIELGSGYPTAGSAAHRNGASCVSCHMGTPTNSEDGGHTWVPTDNTCIECHTGAVPTEVSGLAGDMATLAGLLDTIGIVHDGHPVRGTYTLVEAQAGWNYLLILEDASNGIHNPVYARTLIQNSIAALQ